MSNLKDRVVIITGATGGLGTAVAHTFAEQGASLVLISRDQEKLDDLTRHLNLSSHRLLTFAADLTELEAVQDLAEAVSDKFGRAEALIHLVGGWTGGKTISESGADEFKSMLDQHAWTTIHLLRVFSPMLSANGWGRIIAVSSPSATIPAAKTAAYGMAKAAQEAILFSLAEEHKGTNLTVNVIQVRSIDVNETGKGTSPREIVATMLFICSDDARKVNGARIPLYNTLA